MKTSSTRLGLILLWTMVVPQLAFAVSFDWDGATILNVVKKTGEQADFVGTTSGNASNGILSYDWEYSSDGGTFSEISGASSTNIFTIASVVSGNAGFYRVIVSDNVSGTVTSVTSQLGILTFVDTVPTVANAINAVARENSGNLLIALDSVFTDPDVDDATGITKSIISTDLFSTDSSYPLTSASIPAGNNNLLVLEIEPFTFGSSNITVRGTEGAGSVDEAFLLVVTEDSAPTLVSNPIATVSVRENAASQTVSITGSYADSDDNVSDMTWDAVTGDANLVTINPASGNVEGSGNTIDLSFVNSAFGSTTVTVTGNSNGKTIDGVINVNISFDQPPTVGNTISNLTVSEDDGSANIYVNGVFVDADTEDSDDDITWEASSSNTSLLTVNHSSGFSGNMYSDNLLDMTLYSETGSVVVTVTGNSNGKVVSTNFTVDIDPVNDAPIIKVDGTTATGNLTMTSVGEDETLIFSNAGNYLQIQDDADVGNLLDVQIYASQGFGNLTLNDTTNLTALTGDGSDNLNFTGNLNAIASAIDGMNYVPSTNMQGSEKFMVTVNDLGNTGTGGVLTTSANLDITFFAVNDAPLLYLNGSTAPATTAIASAGEEIAYLFNTAAGNFTMSDLDPEFTSSNVMVVTVGASNSNIHFGISDNVSISGNGTTSATIAGNTTDLANALTNFSVQGVTDFDGSEVVTVTLSDNGVAGSPGALTVSANFTYTITNVNDVSVSANNNAITLLEGGSAVLASSNLHYSDVDNTDAEVYASITANVSNGVLSYAGGNFTMADIGAGLVSYTHDGGETTSDSFTFDVLDGAGGNLTSQTFNFTITPVDDAPVASTNTGVTVAEGGTVVINSGNLSYTDVDTANTSLDFTLTSNVSYGTLSVNVAPSGSGNFTMNELLSTGNLIYTHDGSETTSDLFAFTLTDGVNGSLSGNFAITVTPVNDAPTLSTNNGLLLSEGGSAVLSSSNLAVADVDSGNTQLGFYISSNVSNGTLTLSGPSSSGNFTMGDLATGNLTYTHDGSETTSDSFTFDVLDGAGGNLASQTFTFTISPVDDAPTASTNTGVTVAEGGTIVINSGNLSYSDPDTASSNLAFTLTSNVVYGTLSVNVASTGSGNFTMTELLSTGNLIYTHDGSETTSDSFEFSLSDGVNASTNGSFSITVTPVNDAPTSGNNNTVTIAEGGSYTFTSSNLSFADVDNSQSDLYLDVTANVSNGLLSYGGGNISVPFLNAGSGVTYTHDGGETTSDSFTFDALDGAGGNLSGQTFNFVITPVDDAPVASANSSLYLAEGGTVVVGSANLLFTDSDTANSDLNFTLTSNVSNGTLSVNVASSGTGNFTMTELLSTGNLIYVHDGGETTADYFDYQLSDGNTTLTGNVSFFVSPVNDAPTAGNNNAITLNEGGTVVLSSSNLSFVDPDNTDADLYLDVTANVSNGLLSYGGGNISVSLLNGGSVSYTHDGTETTSDSFTFDALDGAGGNLTSQTFNFVINPVDDAPVASANSSFYLAEGGTVVIGSANLLFTDSDTANSDLNFTLTSNVSNGTLSVNVASSGTGNFTMTELLSTGNLIYVHDGGETTSDYFDYQLSDGNTTLAGNFSFFISPVNDAPTSANNNAITLSEGGTVVLSSSNLAFSDPDNTDSQIILDVTGNVSNGVLSFPGGNIDVSQLYGGLVSYTHDGTETTSDSFTFDALDNAGGNLSGQTFNFVITPVDDAPVVSANTSFYLTEGNTVVIGSANLLFTDSDTANSDLNFTLTSNVSSGTLSVNVASSGTGNFTMTELLSTGNLIYVHDGGEATTDYFVYELSDGNTTLTGNVSFFMSPVNDAPTAGNNNAITLDEGGTVVLSSSNLSFVDPDNTDAELFLDVTGNVSNGVLTYAGGNIDVSQLYAGSISYTHDGSETTSDSFTFNALDGAGGNLTGQTFNFVINSVDDAPVNSTNTDMYLAEGGTVVIGSSNLSFTDTDTSNSDLNFTLTTNVSYGTLSVNVASSGTGNFTMTELLSTGNLIYVHDGGEAATDYFVYQLSDGNTTLTGNMTFMVSPVNDAPTAGNNNAITLNEGGTVILTSSDLSLVDPDNTDAELFLDVTGNVSNGVLSYGGGNINMALLNGGSVSYTHDGSETTSDSFTFDALDGAGGNLSSQTFNFNITLVDDAPVVSSNTTMYLAEGGTVVVGSSNLSFTDVDTANSDLNFTLTTNVSYGTLSVNVASSGTGNFTMTELLSTGNLIYVHDGGEDTTDHFVYELSDGNTTLTGNMTFIMSPVNDAPTLSANTTLYVAEGSTTVIPSANLTSSDPDNSDSELGFYLSSNVSNGSLNLAGLIGSSNFTMAEIAAGNLSYTHNGSESPLSDSFSFVVLDGAGGNSQSQTFNLTIVPVDDAPVISANTGITLSEGGSVLISSSNLAFTDVDTTDSNLSFIFATAATSGTLSTNAASSGAGNFTMVELYSAGNVVYTHDGGETTSDSFDYQLTDGTTTITGNIGVTIIPVNDAPSIAVNTGVTLLEGGTAGITTSEFSATDPDHTDSDILFTLVSTVANGNLWLSGNSLSASSNFTQADIVAGSLSYVHNDSETTSDNIVVTVTDGVAANSSNVTLAFSVTPVNEAPSISGTPGLSATAGSGYSFTASASDVDLGDTLTFSFTSTPSLTWASVNTTSGELSGTPSASDDGTYSIVMTVTDSGNLSASLASFDLVVNDGVNPTATFSPVEGTTGVDPRTTIVATFDEAMYFSGTLLSNTHLSSLTISLSDGGGSGNNLTYTASVSTDSTSITVTPDFIFNPSANIALSIDATAITDVGLLPGSVESVSFIATSLTGDLAEIQEASIAQTILRKESTATLNLKTTQIPSVDQVQYFFVDSSDGTVLKTDTVTLSTALDGSSVFLDISSANLVKGDNVQAILVPRSSGLAYYPFSTVARTITNTAPTAPTSLSYSPSQPPLAGSDVVLTVNGSTDVDSDSITYNYVWLANGNSLLSDNGSSPYTLGSANFSQGDQLKVTVTPTDGTDTGLPASIYFTIGANAPIASISSNVTELFANQTFTLDASSSMATDLDSNGNLISITRYDFDWTGDAVTDATESLGDSDFDGLVNLSLTKGTHTATVTVTDSNSVQSMASVNVVVSNSLPVIDSIAFSSSNIDVTADLGVTLSTSDVDSSDTITNTYRWFINDVESSVTDSTLSANLLTKGDKVTVMVTPNDGTEDGATRSVLGEVENAVPVVPAVSISPTSPSASDNLTAVHSTPTDADGDTLTVSYTWYRDETVVASQTSSIVDASVTGFGEVWRVEVVADDGTDSAISQSGNVGVGNVAPVVNNIAVSQFSGTYADNISVLVTAFDFEGDALTYSYDFNNDGTVDLTSSSENVTWNFVKGTYNIHVIAADSIASGNLVSPFQMVIANTAPVANAGVDLTVNVNSTVSISGNGTDIDAADLDNLTYSWTVVSSTTTNPTLTGASTDTVSFDTTQEATYVIQLTVSDGEAQHVDTVTVTVSDLFATTATGTSLDAAAESTLITNLQTFDYANGQDVAEALNLIFTNVQNGVSDSVRNTVLTSFASILDNTVAGTDLGTDADLIVKSLDLLLPVNDSNKPALDSSDVTSMLDIMDDLGDSILSQTQVNQSFGFLTNLVVDQSNGSSLSASSLRQTGTVAKKLIQNLVQNALSFSSIQKPGEGTQYSYTDSNSQMSVVALPVNLTTVIEDIVLADGVTASLTVPQAYANNKGGQLALAISTYQFNINRQDGTSSTEDPLSAVYSIDLINTDGTIENVTGLSDGDQFTITITYDESLFTYENRAIPMFFSDANTWLSDGISSNSVDSTNNTVTFKVTHLTDFAVFQDTTASEGLSGGGGGCLLK